MKTLFIDMDGVLVNFQSGMDRLDGVEKFSGELLHFGPEGKYKDWESVVEYLLSQQ